MLRDPGCLLSKKRQVLLPLLALLLLLLLGVLRGLGFQVWRQGICLAGWLWQP
jgi:hypothetical protein